ncbi:MAG: hypothetical protein RIG77_00965 [Cyclobacteriaceae bacterium]
MALSSLEEIDFKMRVFIGPQEVAGYYSRLTQGFKELGYSCDFLSYKSHKFGYDLPVSNFWLLRTLKSFYVYRENLKSGNLARRIVLGFVGRVIHLVFFITALFRYDVFIFTYGSSLFRKNRDLPIIRFFNKKIIMNVGHGSELRPPYVNGAFQSPDGTRQPSLSMLKDLSEKYSRQITYLERYCSYLVGAPYSSSQFSTKRFINWFALGVPIKGASDDKQILVSTTNRIRILHSPSHPALKGSDIIRTSITQLKDQGYDIEFIELIGRPNAEVINELKKCDFVVDQLYSDTPLASFATEAAWYGKPAIVGGYQLEELKSFIKDDMFPPSYLCHPDGITEAIETLIVNTSLRKELGQSAKEFVHHKWVSIEVAKRYIQIVEGEISNDWWLDPKEVTYLYGVGQPACVTKERVLKMIQTYGVDSLQLNHNKKLESAFVQFAQSDLKDA